MTSFSIYLIFIKIKNHKNYFWNIFVFFSTQVHYILFYKYTPISHFIKWNVFFFPNILFKLYSNIIYKSIVIFFQKFEVGYTQTCTSIERNTMWQPKGGHCNVLSFWMSKETMFNIARSWDCWLPRMILNIILEFTWRL